MVGTPRVVAAGGNILAALVFEIMVAGPQHRLTALAGIRSTPVLPSNRQETSPDALARTQRGGIWPAFPSRDGRREGIADVD